MKMRVGITGATGFVGKRLIERLVAEKYHVTAFVHKKEGDFHKRVKVIQGDLVTRNGLRDFLSNIDCLIHLAARQIPPDGKMFLDNVIATHNLLEMALHFPIQHVISISSIVVYGDHLNKKLNENDRCFPTTIYGLTKYLSEILCQYWKSKTKGVLTMLRPFNIYGEESTHGVIYNVLRNVRTSKPITIFGDGTQTRDFLYIGDLIEAIMLTLKKKQSDIYNLGSGKSISLNTLVQLIEKILGRKVSICYKESEVEKPKNISYSIQKAQKELHWHASVPIEEGLKKMLLLPYHTRDKSLPA